MMDFMNQLQNAQNQMGDIKKKLKDVELEAEAENGLVKVKANGNKKILSIIISDDIKDDKEAIEDLTTVAINRVLEKAEEAYELEMQEMAKDMLPNLQGMFGK